MVGTTHTIRDWVQGRRSGCYWLLLALLWQAHVTQQSPAVQMQLHKQRISEHADVEYVQRIMQLAKAAEMRNYMQPDADACDDFYTYACGNWARINPADVNTRSTSFFELLINAYEQKQLQLLQEGESPEDSATDGMVKQFFESCRSKPSKRYRLKLNQIIEEFGRMPALMPSGTWNEREFDWVQTIAQIQHKYGMDIILRLEIRKDFDNNTLNKLFIGQPSFKLQTKSMYTGAATKWHRDQYQEEIQQHLQKYLHVDEQQALAIAAQILDFEVQLAAGISDNKLSTTFKAMTKLRTRHELQEDYAPFIDFDKYLVTALGQEYNETIYEYAVDYQLNLVNVLKKTPKDHLANYIFYQLIREFFVNHEQPTDTLHRMCLMRTKQYFARVLDNMIFRRYNQKHNNKTINDINMIWQKLKATFQAKLESDQLAWMSLMTRKLSIDKLAAMKLEINNYENANFTQEYANLNITSTDLIKNMQQIRMFETRRVLAELYEPPKPIESGLELSYTPAYISRENLIKIPVSLLQPNFLWSDYYPNALKFGTLGYLVAHELLHGFDDKGCNYDIDGYERNWWDASSTNAFGERKKCFKRQYARFRYGGVYLPESDLQSENIADNGAVQLAFDAYTNWLDERGANKTTTERKLIRHLELLPNMNYSHKQLFFISFAQFWCSDVSQQYKDKVALVNIHAPAMFRVIGPLANFNVFAEEFHCAAGTTMNPSQKCQIY